MPFGHWSSFDDCVADMQSKQGYDIDTARATCGKLQAEMGGSVSSPNFVSYELDKNGELFLKYFFADSSLTQLPTAQGRFSLNGAALALNDDKAIGLPFSILPSKDLSVFGDYHPWHPDLGKASYEQHVEFARRYSPGSIVAITPTTKLTGAFAQDVVNNNGRFAVVHITDKRARDAYVARPELIPKAVSPGFLNHEYPNKNDIKNFQWAHLAAVPQGAYGPKATLYGSCVGAGQQCVSNLIGASAKAKEVDTRIKMSYCPIGASEALLNTSLINSDAILNNMSAQQADSTTTSTVSPQQTTTPTTQPVQTGAPVVKPEVKPTQKPILRLKNQTKDPLQTEQGQEQKPQDISKLEEVERKLAEIEAREQANERQKQIRNIIDMRLFTVNGKYNQKEHEAAIAEAANSQWTDEQISKYYGGLLRIKEFEEAQNQNNKSRGLNSYNPLGGSYVTPSSVPELMGASGQQDMDLDTFRLQKVKGLMEMFHREGI